MRVKVDYEICQGCGICETIAPLVFRLQSEPYAVALVKVVPPDQESSAREATDACPEQAILLND